MPLPPIKPHGRLGIVWACFGVLSPLWVVSWVFGENSTVGEVLKATGAISLLMFGLLGLAMGIRDRIRKPE